MNSPYHIIRPCHRQKAGLIVLRRVLAERRFVACSLCHQGNKCFSCERITRTLSYVTGELRNPIALKCASQSRDDDRGSKCVEPAMLLR